MRSAGIRRTLGPSILALMAVALPSLAAVTVEVDERQLWIDPPPAGSPVRGVVLWLHAAERGALADRERFLASNLPAEGVVLAFYEGTSLGWRDHRDRARVLAALRTLRQRFDLEPERTLLAGQADGAAFAQRLVLERPYWFAGALLVGGADGGAWEAADAHRPVFGIYADTSDRTVPVHGLRKIEHRLRETGYPVLWRSQIVDPHEHEAGYGDGVFALLRATLAEAGWLAPRSADAPIASP